MIAMQTTPREERPRQEHHRDHVEIEEDPLKTPSTVTLEGLGSPLDDVVADSDGEELSVGSDVGRDRPSEEAEE